MALVNEVTLSPGSAGMGDHAGQLSYEVQFIILHVGLLTDVV